jgi:hypothetical protein
VQFPGWIQRKAFRLTQKYNDTIFCLLLTSLSLYELDLPHPTYTTESHLLMCWARTSTMVVANVREASELATLWFGNESALSNFGEDLGRDSCRVTFINCRKVPFFNRRFQTADHRRQSEVPASLDQLLFPDNSSKSTTGKLYLNTTEIPTVTSKSQNTCQCCNRGSEISYITYSTTVINIYIILCKKICYMSRDHFYHATWYSAFSFEHLTARNARKQ